MILHSLQIYDRTDRPWKVMQNRAEYTSGQHWQQAGLVPVVLKWLNGHCSPEAMHALHWCHVVCLPMGVVHSLTFLPLHFIVHVLFCIAPTVGAMYVEVGLVGGQMLLGCFFGLID